LVIRRTNRVFVINNVGRRVRKGGNAPRMVYVKKSLSREPKGNHEIDTVDSIPSIGSNIVIQPEIADSGSKCDQSPKIKELNKAGGERSGPLHVHFFFLATRKSKVPKRSRWGVEAKRDLVAGSCEVESAEDNFPCEIHGIPELRVVET